MKNISKLTKTILTIAILLSTNFSIIGNATEETGNQPTSLKAYILVLYCQKIEWDNSSRPSRPIPTYYSRLSLEKSIDLATLKTEKEMVILSSEEFDFINEQGAVTGRGEGVVRVKLTLEENQKITAKVSYQSTKLPDFEETDEYESNEFSLDPNTGFIAEFNICDDYRMVGQLATKVVIAPK